MAKQISFIAVATYCKHCEKYDTDRGNCVIVVHIYDHMVLNFKNVTQLKLKARIENLKG